MDYIDRRKNNNNNNKGGSTMIAGIDIGYGYTKIYTEQGKLIFPTLVSKSISRGDFGEDRETITVNGTPYIAGDQAEVLLGNHRVTKDFIGTPDYYAVLGYALKKIKTRPDILVLGLPPAFYNKETVQTLKSRLYAQEIKNSQGLTIPIPRRVEYIPQGAGIYFSHVSDGHEYCQSKNVAIIDIGYYTVDTTLFSSGKYITEAGRSYPAGIFMLIDRVKTEYSKKYGSFISEDAAMKLLKSGQFVHFGETHKLNVEEIILGFINDQILNIVKDYSVFLKGMQKTVDISLIGGGGVSYIADYVSNITVVSDPQFANAKGFYEYGVSLAEDIS
jgi:hypothetical protein